MDKTFPLEITWKCININYIHIYKLFTYCNNVSKFTSTFYATDNKTYINKEWINDWTQNLSLRNKIESGILNIKLQETKWTSKTFIMAYDIEKVTRICYPTDEKNVKIKSVSFLLNKLSCAGIIDEIL